MRCGGQGRIAVAVVSAGYAIEADAPPGDRHIGEHAVAGEEEWNFWLTRHPVNAVDVERWLPAAARLVVVAPHPDDEILAAGGLMALAARLTRQIEVVAVSDGTASHPGSTRWTQARLARQRPRETARALRALGVGASTQRLGFQDGALAASIDPIAVVLGQLLRPTDVVVTTWRLDGHPDHEATGEACARAAHKCGARLVEAPVWAWQWARPGDARWPWARACRLALPDDVVQRKGAAVAAFRSQLEPDPDTGRGPILVPSIVDRAARPFELFFA